MYICMCLYISQYIRQEQLSPFIHEFKVSSRTVELKILFTSLSPTACHAMEQGAQLASQKSTVGEAQRFQVVVAKEGF